MLFLWFDIFGFMFSKIFLEEFYQQIQPVFYPIVKSSFISFVHCIVGESINSTFKSLPYSECMLSGLIKIHHSADSVFCRRWFMEAAGDLSVINYKEWTQNTCINFGIEQKQSTLGLIEACPAIQVNEVIGDD